MKLVVWVDEGPVCLAFTACHNVYVQVFNEEVESVDLPALGIDP